MALWNPRDVQHVSIANIAASTDIVAAPGAGRQIIVLGWLLTADTAGEFNWRSNTTALTGLMEIVADTPIGDRDADVGCLKCAANQALNLNPTVAVNGVVRYVVLSTVG